MTFYEFPILGGALIGLSAVLMMATLGRIAGISGIAGGLLAVPRPNDFAWRIAFVAGLVLGPLVAALVAGRSLLGMPTVSPAMLIIAGLLVGLGTGLGSGCTSGHGVCGIARLSPRSIVATATFMLAGFATVFIVRHVI